MRVLVTGVTGAHVGTGSRYALHSAVPGVVNALQHLGVDHEHRAVEAGEDLSGFTHAIVFLGSPALLGAYHLCGALWAVRNIPGVVLACDDWAAPAALAGGFRSCAKKPEGGLWRYQTGIVRRQQEEWKRYEKELLETAGTFPWQRTFLLPLWDWSVSTRIPNLDARVVGFDPTSLLPGLRDECLGHESVERERKWVHAAASTQKSWVEFKKRLSWPVDEYGGSRLGNSVTGGRRRNVWLSTREVCARYAGAWGTVVQAYPKNSTPVRLGWWRTRLYQAVLCNSVAYCIDPLEGPPEWRGRPLPEVFERLTDLQLVELSRRQRESLLGWVQPAEVAAQRVYQALVDAARHA